MTEQVEELDLWTKLIAIPRPHQIVDLPRNDPATGRPVGKIAMWPLTQKEQMICNAEADRFTKALLKDPQKKDEANFGYQHTFGNDIAIQILFRCCRYADNLEKPFFPSTVMMREQLAAEEISVLFNTYMIVQVELGPIIRHLSDEECEAWLRRIHEEGSAYPFSTLSLETQIRLLSFSAAQLVNFWTGTSSAGAPQDAQPSRESVEDPTDAPDEPKPLEMPNE